MFHQNWTDIAQRIIGLNSNDSIIDLTSEQVEIEELDDVICLNERSISMPVLQSRNFQRERSCSPVIINDSSNSNSSSIKPLTRHASSNLKRQKKDNKDTEKIILSDIDDNETLEEGVIKCPICFEKSTEILKNGKKIVSTTCGHVFCEHCLREALKLNKSCPRFNLLECYVCKDQEDNKDKCIETVKTCVNAEDRCLTIVKWGSTPYWVPSGDKQYYISKRCSSKQNCELLNANLSQKCDAIWYNDWECAECCHGDRCNYYVTLDSSKIRSNQCLIFFLFILYLIIIYSIA